MKVLMTADAVGGVWTYAADLAAGLAQRGVEVVLAVLGPEPSRESRDRFAGDLRVVSAPLDWTAETPEAVLDAGLLVAELAERERVDVVHLNSPALAAGDAFRAPLVGVCHSDVKTWWAAVKTGPLPPDLAWRAALTGRGYAACNALLAPSRSFAEATAAAYGVDAPTVVLNARNPFLPVADKEVARSDGGGAREASGTERRVGSSALSRGPSGPPGHLPSDAGGEIGHPFVFTAGRLWDEGKGMAVLDAGAGSLSAPVLAAGSLDGPNGAAFAPEHLTALGSLSARAMAEHHAAAAVFVSPALYEPFGLAVLEAAHAGRPLVLSDIPTFRELWDGAATFVRPGEADALAAALQGLLADERARDRLGRAAAARAARFTMDATVEGTLAAYRGVAGRRAAA